MKIAISGASGLIGTALTTVFGAENHTVAHLVRPGRRLSAGDIRWDPASSYADVDALEGTDAVVHLSGASVAGGRWTPARKQLLRSSRIDTTRLLVDSLARLKRKPSVFVSASATGYYGNRGDEILSEQSEPGTGFLAELARDWESEAARAAACGIRTVILRFGVILSAAGGALPRMVAPFKFGLGGRVGNGRQWMSWVALDDATDIVRFVIASDRISGSVNAVALPARNVDFARLVGKILRCPAIVLVPAFPLRLAFGEMADALLLSSQRAQPERLLGAGYPFRFKDIEMALRAMLETQ
ncbi:MAG: TIGR01777 family oxidoreductase [Candidatus Acidiferrales bacterium]